MFTFGFASQFKYTADSTNNLVPQLHLHPCRLQLYQLSCTSEVLLKLYFWEGIPIHFSGQTINTNYPSLTLPSVFLLWYLITVECMILLGRVGFGPFVRLLASSLAKSG